MKKNIFIQGQNGKMGCAIADVLSKDKSEIFSKELSRIEKADLILDFSTIAGNKNLFDSISTGKIINKSILIGTTGLEQSAVDDWQKIATKNSLNVLLAPNTSLGIILALKSAMSLVGALQGADFDIEITETHHRNKKDSPSGTAKFLAENISSVSKGLTPQYNRNEARKDTEIGVHAVRGGGVFGEHEIRFISPFEELKISHRAFSRELFASGSLVLGRWLLNKRPNLYHLKDIEVSEFN